jgi:uncharacterized membrane protein YkvA (DUF1232 family)
MPVTVAFELSDRDLEHFIAMAKEAHEAIADQDDAVEQIAAATREVFEKAKGVMLPDFIAERLEKLGVLADMVTDSEWKLPAEELDRVVAAMAYFANPEDLIPDRVPGIGFLDDAIMAELVIENLEAEIAAYRDFCEYRTAERERRRTQGETTDVRREDWMADKRATLQSRMRERRRSRTSSGSWRVRLF